MDFDRLLLAVAVVAIICVTGLVAQCTQKTNECRIEAVKANVSPEKIPSICQN